MALRKPFDAKNPDTLGTDGPTRNVGTRTKVEMMQDIVPTTENGQTDAGDTRKGYQETYLGRCIGAGGSSATIWSNTAFGDGGRAGM